MKTSAAEIPPLIYSKAAGLAYIVIIIAGIFAEFIVRSNLVVPGDAATTAGNIMASGGMFRLSIASDIVMIMCDVALAMVFYVLLRPVSNPLALLAAFFRLIQAAILGANLLNLFFVLHLLSGADYLGSFAADQLHALVMLFLNAHSTGYAIGLIFFGIYLFLLGYLAFKSGYFPKILGALLLFASVGYLTDSFAHVLMPDYKSYETLFLTIVFLPAFIAELSLAVWLLVKGVRVNQPG